MRTKLQPGERITLMNGSAVYCMASVIQRVPSGYVVESDDHSERYIVWDADLSLLEDVYYATGFKRAARGPKGEL